MTQGTQAILLRRMTRSHDTEVAESPLTSSRAVRLTLTKAANDTAGLAVTVSGVAEEVAPLDEMLGSLEDGLMLVQLRMSDRMVGLIALDMQMRSAVLEMQTIGALIAQVAEDRPPTRTDKMLTEPLLSSFVNAFPQSVVGTPLEGWATGAGLGDQVDSARTAGLVLEDRDYRIVRMSVDLGVADRQGLLVMALPLIHKEPELKAVMSETVDWHGAFEQAVNETPACLNAQLHRFAISLATAEALEIGDVLPLPGCTVNSVLLLDPDGNEVAQAKLGQIGGKRALRLQYAPVPQLSDLQANVVALGRPLDFAGDGMVENPAEQPTALSEITPDTTLDVGLEGDGSVLIDPVMGFSDDMMLDDPV